MSEPEHKYVKLEDVAEPVKDTWQPVRDGESQPLRETYEFPATLKMERLDWQQLQKCQRWINAHAGIPDGLPLHIHLDQESDHVEAHRSLHRSLHIQVTAVLHPDGSIRIKGLHDE